MDNNDDEDVDVDVEDGAEIGNTKTNKPEKNCLNYRRHLPKRRRKSRITKTEDRLPKPLSLSSHQGSWGSLPCLDDDSAVFSITKSTVSNSCGNFGRDGSTVPHQQKHQQEKHQWHKSLQQQQQHQQPSYGGEGTMKSLPILLAQRESGFLKNKSVLSWQRDLLIDSSSSSSVRRSRRWREFCSRKISFVALGTPISDAVLSLDSTASFVISVGGSSNVSEDEQHESGEKPSLAMRFYGVPSPCALRKKRRPSASSTRSLQSTNAVISPLLLNIPLQYGNFDAEPFGEGLASSTPVTMWLSHDCRIGVAVFRLWRNTEAFAEGSLTGTSLIFPLPKAVAWPGCSSPHSKQQFVNVLKSHNISVPAVDCLVKGRNLLWQVEVVPCHTCRSTSIKNSHLLCSGVFHLPGYLYFLDEEDGYLLTWILESTWNTALAHDMEDMSSSSKTRPKSNQIMTPVRFGSNWEEFFSERRSGKNIRHDVSNAGDLPGQIKVSFEARFSVQALLVDILLRRPHLVQEFDNSPSKLPTYFYNLVAVTNGGRCAQVLICFQEGTKKSLSMGVFVEVDLFTQEYQELRWFKSSFEQAGGRGGSAPCLRTWCNRLALNWRMRQQKLGPYSVDPQQSRDWGMLCKEPLFDDLDEIDDSDPEIWNQFLQCVKSNSAGSNRVRKRVSLASLYPDCELVDNQAVISHLPVLYMKSRSAPVELIYSF